MQVYVPHPDIRKTMAVMDDQSLAQQRVEAYQLIKCLDKPSVWEHHPAVVLWKDNKDALKAYYNEAVAEWIRRGHKNNMQLKTVKKGSLTMPKWWGKTNIHSEHRSALLVKNPEWYGKFGWDEATKIDYTGKTQLKLETDNDAAFL